jgi:hypothetical protein
MPNSLWCRALPLAGLAAAVLLNVLGYALVRLLTDRRAER